jgi:hypothetical protein
VFTSFSRADQAGRVVSARSISARKQPKPRASTPYSPKHTESKTMQHVAKPIKVKDCIDALSVALEHAGKTPAQTAYAGPVP